MSEPSFAERALASIEGGRLVTCALEPRRAAGTVTELCRRALAAPVGSPALAELAKTARRIVVIISDASRDEPREEMLDVLFEVLPRERVTIVVAAGTHVADASVVPEKYRDLPVVVQEGSLLSRFADLGVTREGTPVRILREVAGADLIVVTGRLRPHYFAGYSGGVKGLFPGTGYQEDVLRNHLFKADPTAKLGKVDGNRCRLDMEDAASRAPGRVVILNVLSDCDGAPQMAVSGHAVLAHRALVAHAAPLFRVRVPRSPVIIVADKPPVTRSLYQASKMLPPAGAVLAEGGTVVMVAECDQGIEPRERVNEGIYRLGVARALPNAHRVILVSALPEAVVKESYASFFPDLRAALASAAASGTEPIPVIWRAGEAIAEPA